jgi:hypothetical protein
MRISTHLLLVVGAGCTAVALIFGASHLDNISARQTVHCAETRSLDGTKSLSLWPDGEADLAEVEQSTSGRWSYEKATQTYAITINGATTDYHLIEKDDIRGCMLVRGALEHTNILEALFAAVHERPANAPQR